MSEGVRVDKWLWAVRVFKTRTAAGDACAGGRVKVNGESAKAARRVTAGDRVVARRGDRVIDYQVVATIERRVGAARAQECYVDHSPPPEPRPGEATPRAVPGGSRDRGAGRPTKRDRRAIDRLRGGGR